MLARDTVYTQRETRIFIVKKRSDPVFMMATWLSDLVSRIDEYTNCIYCGQALKGGYCEKCGAPQNRNTRLGLYKFTISSYLPYANPLIDFDVADEIHIILQECRDLSEYQADGVLFRIVVTKIESRSFTEPVSNYEDNPLEYKIEAIGSVEYHEQLLR